MDINWQPGMTIESVEKAVIQKAFKFYQGNKTQTARSLDISIRTLENKLAKYDGRVLENESGTTDESARVGNGITQRPLEENKSGESRLASESGLRLEPDVKASQKQSMPLRKRA